MSKMTVGILFDLLKNQLDSGLSRDTEVVLVDEKNTQVQACTLGFCPVAKAKSGEPSHAAVIAPLRRRRRAVIRGGGPDVLPDSIGSEI